MSENDSKPKEIESMNRNPYTGEVTKYYHHDNDESLWNGVCRSLDKIDGYKVVTINEINGITMVRTTGMKKKVQ